MLPNIHTPSQNPRPGAPHAEFSGSVAQQGLGSPHKNKGAYDAQLRAVTDMTHMTNIAAGLRMTDMAGASPVGVPAGAAIMTLDGALPVDHLYPGDQVVTRRGAQRIDYISKIELPMAACLVEVTENALGGRPDQPIRLPMAQRVLLRDWRAKALYGQAQACVPAGQLVDGTYIRLVEADGPVTFYQISFGRPEIIHADGLELASADDLVVHARA